MAHLGVDANDTPTLTMLEDSLPSGLQVEFSGDFKPMLFHEISVDVMGVTGREGVSGEAHKFMDSVQFFESQLRMGYQGK